MTISRVAHTTQRLCQAFSAPELVKLRALFHLPRSAKIEEIADAMWDADLSIDSLSWYLEIDLVPETQPSLYSRLCAQFSAREIAVIYTKLGFTPGYEPVTIRMRRIADLAENEDYTLEYLRELCDTRREAV